MGALNGEKASGDARKRLARTVQRKKLKKYYSTSRRTLPDEAAIRIEGRDGHDGQRSNGGDVWASICGFDSV